MNDMKLELFDERYRPMIKLLHAKPMPTDQYLSEEDEEILAELQESRFVRINDDGFIKLDDTLSNLLSK